jgi:hypothetical protein
MDKDLYRYNPWWEDDFEKLWKKLWGENNDKDSVEYITARDKFNTIDRKKIVDSDEIIQMNRSNDISPSPNNNYNNHEVSTKKKTKGAKIIDTLLPLNQPPVKMNNIILLLKCSIREIDEYIQQNIWNSDSLNYNPNVPNEIIAYEQKNTIPIFGDWQETIEKPLPTTYLEENQNKNKDNSEYTKPNVCSICNNDTLSENEYHKIKQLKIQFYKNDLQDKKSDCFWCTYPFDNEPCYILQYGLKNDIYGHGSFCSPECGVAYLFGKQMDLDDSAKTESYQLMNYYYGKPNQYQQSIKPALIPYYLLEKFYGNLTIQEYRKLTKSQHMLLGLILLLIFTASSIVYLWFELSITNDRLRWLEERLIQLEKDAIKIKFKKEIV